MKRGRKRGINPDIPTHIDQAKIPDGVYWDNSGSGRWLIAYYEGAQRRRKRLAARDATLADLHYLAETFHGVERGTLSWLCGLFHESAQFLDLSRSTRVDYEYCRRVLQETPTRIGKPLSGVQIRLLNPPTIQKLVDKLATERGPSAANHVLRYLRRMCRWGMNRGYCASNPTAGVEGAKERPRQHLPPPTVFAAVRQFAQEQGPPYLWIVMELAHTCRLRGIEVVTLTDANALEEGIQSNRRKGSRDNITRWGPRTRAAWAAAIEYRTQVWQRKKIPYPMAAADRPLIVGSSGGPLRKSSLNSAWQRMITAAIEQGVIELDQRFSLHDLKRRGVTDTPGTRNEKQDASGHRSASMMDVYDKSMPIVDGAGDAELSGELSGEAENGSGEAG